MKKKEDMIHKFIYILILLALLFSSNLFAQQTNKRTFRTEKELLELFKHARFPQLFKFNESMYEQQRLRLTDTDDSLNVRLISRCPFGPCFAVAGVGSIAYFGNGGYLEIVDFSNPADPLELGRVLAPAQISRVAVLDDYVYVVDDKAALHIINVSSPNNPQEVSRVDIYDEIKDVALSGNYTYIATLNGLQVIDISDPATPQLKDSISTGENGQCVAVSGNYAYVGDIGTGLHVIDISNPTKLQEVSTYETDFQYSSIAISGNYAYIADYKFGLRIIDISNPVNLNEVGNINIKITAEMVKVSENYAYIASGSSGLLVIDVSNPTNPFQAGSIDTDDAIDITLGDNYAYVADYSGLRVIEINNPINPQEVGYFATGLFASGMAFQDNYVYVADGDGGIFVIDISNPASPILTSHFLTTFEALDVLCVGNYLYVAGGDSGIQVLYASDPNSLLYKNMLDVGGYVFSMTGNGNFVYVAATYAGLRVIDVSNPKNPQEVGYFDTQGNVYNVAVSGDYAYVADGEEGLRIIDITSPTNLQEVGYFDTEGIALRVAVSNNYAYVADGETGLRVIDVSNPENPQEVGNFATKNISHGVTISGNNVYLADGEAGLRVIDVSDPETPQEMGYFDTGNTAINVVLRDNYVYVADGLDGLYILEYLNLPPMAPILFQPANNSYINDDTPRLIWNVPSDPEGNELHFMVELALNSDFSVPISNSPFISEEDTTGFSPLPPLAEGSGTCSYTLQVPLDDQKYYWRVSAKDANTYGSVSEDFSFIIDTQPPFTSDHSPAKDSDNVTANTDIVVHVKDTSSGVDNSSIVMNVNGSTVTPNITGTAADYAVIYSPPTDFDYDQTVTVSIDARDNAGNQMITDYYSFQTTAIETTPNIVLEPTYWDYGLVPIGSSADETFVVSNSGEATLEVSGLNIEGTDSEQFSIVNSEDTFSVSPGDSQNIVVRFSPIWTGEYTAMLQISSNDPDDETAEIDLTGTGEAVTVSSLIKPNEQPGGSEQTAYRLVSIPLDLDDSSIESVLEDDLGPYDINEWRLFDYVDGQYFEYPDVSQFTPGRSLWLILKESAMIGCGYGKLISDKYFSIPLDPGWNPIATPYNQSIPLENLSLVSGNSLQLWYYDGWWDDYIESLNPWEGYGLLNDGFDLDTLLIYPDFTGNMHKANNTSTDKLLDWWIQIEASCEQTKDPRNILGVSQQASSDWDRLDRGEPPAVGKYVMVYFDHPEWERVIRKYSLDCRPTFTGGETWQFNVSSNMGGKEIELNFIAIETVPEEYDIVLLDYETMTKQDLRKQRCFKFYYSTELDAPRLFNLLIGSQNYIEEASTKFQSLPTSFHLSEGYPNPFNAATTFQLNLPQSDQVSIEIYDLLGRKVVDLMNNKGIDAGTHHICWNGKSQSGELVSSGIYLVLFKMRNSHIVIRKVVLIK